MTASREMFWNIQLGNLVYILGLIAIVVVAYTVYRRYRLWRSGQPENRLNKLVSRIRSFIVLAIVDGVAHRRILRQPYSGIMHLFLFGGAIILLLGTLSDALSHYFFHFLHGRAYLWESLLLDVAGLLILVGVGMAFLRRYVQKPARLDNVTDDALVLSLIALLVVSGFVIEGIRVANTELQAYPEWAVWSPVGFVLAKGFSGLDTGALLALHKTVWWFHVLLFVGGAVYAGLAWSKFSHILVAPANVFLRSLRHRGVPVAIDIMNAERFGASKIGDFAWKHLLDLDACTRCGRCQDNCPAYLTGKPLSPKTLTQHLKTHMLEAALHPAAATQGEAGGGNGSRALIGDVVTEEELWACTTCGACEEVCPIFVEHTDKIIDMRRNLVLEQAKLPQTVQASLTNTQQRGHPWKGTVYSRTDWASNLEVPRASEGGDPGLLFWVGCTGALEERNTRVTAAFAKLLTTAGVKFSILGEQESCCGHFARRLGDEYLFQVQVEKNVEVLKRHNVQRIVTACPHCYHTLKNEYPQFGGKFQVLHHTEVIADLLRKGSLKFTTGKELKITYQDPCYLGRYNDIYTPPRKVLKSLPNVRLVEMPRHKSRALCCGGGGGRMWIEEPPNQRVNQFRFKEVISTGADIVVTACPFCLQMSEDARKALGKEDSMKAMDLAELVATSLMVLVSRPSEVKPAPSVKEGVVQEAPIGREA